MTESTSEYKKRIEEIKQSIENEPYMAKMREDIAEGISKTGVRQATVEEQFQSVLDETTDKDVISAPEVILARGGAQTLGERLDSDKAEVSAQLQQTEQSLNTQLAQKALQSDLEIERSRISNLTANAGDTDGNAELLDIRIGFDGITYPTAGEATRTIGNYMTDENQPWEV